MSRFTACVASNHAFRFLQQVPVHEEGDDAVNANACAKEQGDGGQRGCEDACLEQHEGYAIDSHVGDDGLVGQQFGSSFPVKHAVHERVVAVEDVKREQDQDQTNHFLVLINVQHT